MAVLLVGSMLLLTGCEAFDFLLDLFEPMDFSTSTDPGVQASGVSHDTAKKVDDAETTVHDVLNGDKPPEELDDLRAVRPADAKIANYVFWLATLDGNSSLMGSASDAAQRLHNAALAGHPASEIDRRWQESNLETMSDVINTQQPGAGAGEDQFARYGDLVDLYCSTLRNYRTHYGGSAEGLEFLQFANTGPCPGFNA